MGYRTGSNPGGALIPAERHALAYAAQGFSVIPLWFPDKDGSCPCGTDCGKSKGKHPIGKLAPNGVSSATRDVKIIAKWFQSDQKLNVGVACGPMPNGRKLVVFDVDNTEVARAILTSSELNLADETGVAGTGKGCHIYMYSDMEVGTHELFLDGVDHKTGRVGEIRSVGSYVVAPPSRHYSGKRYRWFGQPEDDDSIPEIESIADPDKFAAHICGKAGYQLEPPMLAGGELPEGSGPIEPLDLPFTYNALDYQKLWQFMSGTFPSDGDRSLTLYSIAREIRDVAVTLGEVVTGEQLQGVLKKLDQTTYHKYTGNARYKDPDAEYRRIVWGKKGVLRQDATTTYPSTAPLIEQQEKRATGRYGWDPKRMMTVLYGKKDDMDLFNFKPFIEEELEIDTGDEVSRAFKITFAQELGSVSLYLTPEDMETERAIRRRVYEECPASFNVYPEGWKHLTAVLRDLSKDITKRRVYRHTGWINTADGRAFILQGSGGAITTDNINHDLLYEDDPKDNINSKLRLYGAGVRPIVTERDTQRAEQALIALIKSATPAVVIPIIAQVIAGPLTSHGADTDPPLVHVTGKTGSMKTSLTTACLSIFGTFDRANVPESWMSTMASLQALLYACKDETLMIDDYKVGTAGRVASLIQQYSDRTTRSRMASDQRMRKRMYPRGLMISTGEDMWEDQESTMARTIVVDMTREDVSTRDLTRIQEMIPEGWLQLVGGAFLSWLTDFEPEELTDWYTDVRRKILKQMQESLSSNIHGRLIGGLASLISASRIFERFLKEQLPKASVLYVTASHTAWAARAAALAVQGEEARETSPYNQVMADMLSSLQSKEAKLVHAEDDNRVVGGGLSTACIGYFDDNFVYISRNSTWQWFSKRRQQRGDPSVFTWRSVRKDAIQSMHGADDCQLWARANLRFVKIPRTEIRMLSDGVDALWADFANQADVD